MTLTIDGSPVGAPIALTGGVAVAPPLSGLAPGGHFVSATYSGDPNYGPNPPPAVQPVPFNQVIRIPTVTNITASAEPSVFGGSVIFSASVHETVVPTSSCTPLTPPPCGAGITGSVAFTVDGGGVGSAVLNALVTASAPPITDLAPGIHHIVATYGGDGFNMGSVGALSHSVGCSVVVTGTVHGGLAVTASTCVSGATIDGGVRVNAGAAIVITTSRVNGGLAISHATGVLICGTTINGQVSVTSDTGLIEIGDGGDPPAGANGCAGNTIHGGLVLTSNQGVIEVGGNHISGPMTVSDSISRASVLVSASPEIEGNRISGPLACTNNTPAPTDDGQRNAVSGPMSGQCADAGF